MIFFLIIIPETFLILEKKFKFCFKALAHQTRRHFFLITKLSCLDDRVLYTSRINQVILHNTVRNAPLLNVCCKRGALNFTQVIKIIHHHQPVSVVVILSSHFMLLVLHARISQQTSQLINQRSL